MKLKHVIKLLDFIIKAGIVVIIMIMISCEERLPNNYENFTIPEGKHAPSIPKAQSLQSQILSFHAIFDATAIYKTESEENQHDINKLLGFADCNSHHHENSARFGWRWLNDSLEIHTYTYSRGKRASQLIGKIELNTPYLYEIQIQDDYYTFSLEGFDPVDIKREPKCRKGLYYMLFPYFGGDEVAPQDIHIGIEFLY